VRFVIRRQGKVLEIPIVPCKMKVLATHMRMLDKEIGYERIESFVPDDLTKIVEEDLSKLVGAKALILDLRGNPGGSVNSCLDIATLFLDSGDLVTPQNVDWTKVKRRLYATRSSRTRMEVVTTANERTGVTSRHVNQI
jgi:Periplasmic protease